MQLVAVKKTEDSINLHYETTYINSWQNCLDIMQVIFDDSIKNLNGVGYIEEKGEPVKPIHTVIESLLYKTPELQEEKTGLFVSGKPDSLGFNINVMIYNQSNAIDIKVWFKDGKAPEHFEKTDHAIDKYMDSVEITGHGRRAFRAGMENLNKYIDTYSQLCSKYNNDINFDKLTKDEKENLAKLLIHFKRMGLEINFPN